MKNGIKTYQCIGCGVTVTKSCTNKVKYCTTACYHKHGKKGRPKNGSIKKCMQCGEDFYAPNHRVSKVKTCSVKCGNAYQGRNKVKKTCENCGCEFFISPAFVNNGNRRFCTMQCRNDSDVVKSALLKLRTEQSKKNPNNFEILAYSILDSIGIEYEAQAIIAEKFTVDAFIPSKSIVLQFDGDYWHGNPKTNTTFDSRQQKRMMLDKSQDAYMKKIGITVFRFWQSDFKDLSKITEKIKQCL